MRTIDVFKDYFIKLDDLIPFQVCIGSTLVLNSTVKCPKVRIKQQIKKLALAGFTHSSSML